MKSLKITILSLLISLLSLPALAVPAFPELIKFQQPHSETFVNIYLKGDERVHWAESEDGYSLLHDDNGALCYAIPDGKGGMIPSNILATNVKERPDNAIALLKDTPKHLHFSHDQVDDLLQIWSMVENAKSGPKTMTDVTGNKQFLVILFAFNDQDFHFGVMDFRRMFNQVNYRAEGATGSVRDYYYDVSGGLFSLHVDVVGPFIGSENTAFYGNTNQGYQAFAREAVDSAAQYVDFSNYDNDGDGYIDGLHIIFAGHGEEAGASADHIWSHKWNIFDAPTYNNTVIDVYSCSPELSGSSGNNLTRIGVICHELGHVFGAPDFYDTDYESSGGQFPGLGAWDIMSSGSWNQGGACPAHHNPYTKVYIYRWASADTINNLQGAFAIDPVENNNNPILRINTSSNGDFFLLENRQKIKWDRYAPSHGLLVYHIHPSAHGASVSNASHPQQIYILANGQPALPSSSPSSYGILGGDNAPFPGDYYAPRDSLTDFSLPSLRPWSAALNNTPIYNISENTDNQKIYFTFRSLDANPLFASAEELSNTQIQLNWSRYGAYNTIILMNPSSDTFGIPTDSSALGDTIPGGGIVIYRGPAESLTLNQLQPNHLYHFKFFSISPRHAISKGITAAAQTLNCDGSDWNSQNFETTPIGQNPECWSGSWSVDSIQGTQALTTFTSCLSQGDWKSATSAPILLDSVRNAVLMLRFMLGEGNNENSIFKVEYRANPNDSWTTLAQYNWHFGMADWNEIYLPLSSLGNYSRIRFSLLSDNCALAAIDDIQILPGILLNADADPNGSIHPFGNLILNPDTTVTFTITPLQGFQLANVTFNGTTIPASQISLDSNNIATLTITPSLPSNTIYATFQQLLDINHATQHSLSIFPNPTNDILNILAQGNNTIELYTITGQLLLRQQFRDATTLHLSNLQPGIYILRAGSQARKIIKK